MQGGQGRGVEGNPDLTVMGGNAKTLNKTNARGILGKKKSEESEKGSDQVK